THGPIAPPNAWSRDERAAVLLECLSRCDTVDVRTGIGWWCLTHCQPPATVLGLMSGRLSAKGRRACRVRPRACDRWPCCQSDRSLPLREVACVFVVPAYRDIELVLVVAAYLVLLDQMVHDV